MEMAKEKKGIKPALSLWALLARSSIYKIMGIMLVMAAAEIMLFCLGRKYALLSDALGRSYISVVFLAALGLTVCVLSWTEGRLDRKSSATMLRLRLSPGSMYLVRTVYNVLCLAVLFMVQIWLAILLVAIYGKEMTDAYASSQRLFLAFYRIEFLHCLLPMAETGKWVRNLLLLLAFGMEAAGKDKKKNVTLNLLYVLTVSWFVTSLGGDIQDVLCGGVYVVIIAVNAWRVWKRDSRNIYTADC